MELKPLKKIIIKDKDLSRSFGYIAEFLNQLMPNKFLVGNILECDVSTTNTAFNHGLGRIPTGWFVISKSTFTDIRSPSSDENVIFLDAEASATIKIWVF
jgi:hypothetical protein